MRVAYIGPKAVKHDNVAGTGLKWAPGQVHDVEPLAAAKLLCHPTIWEKANEEAKAEAEAVLKRRGA